MRERQLIKWLLSFIAHVKGKVVLAVLLGIISNLSVVAIPLIGLREVFLVLNEREASPVRALVIMFCCGLIRGLARYGEQYMNHDIAFSLLAKIREQIFGKIRILGPAKVTGKKSGDLIAVITSDVEALEVFFAHTISPVLIALGTTMVTVGFMWTINPLLASILVCGQFLVGVFVPLVGYRKSHLLGDRYQEAFVALNQAVMEIASSLQDITQYSLEKLQLSKLTHAGQRVTMQYKKRLSQEGLLRIMSELLLLGTAVCIFLVGVYEKLSQEQVLTAVVLSLSSFGSVLALSGLGSALLTTFASGRRLARLTDEQPNVDFSMNHQQVDTFENVSLEDVSFAYDKKKAPVIENSSLGITAGDIIGIGGESGSGKSTIVKLLMRYWDPDSGTITIGDHNLATIKEDSLHETEGVMEQTTFIFADTIAANIGLGKTTATKNEIMEAAQKAAIHEWILSLPDQYDTKIGGTYREVSDGERQRIGMARLFLHDAPFLLLDEPTSNLDYLNEQAILRSLVKGIRDKTVVVISHRETTLDIASKRYGLEAGQLKVK